MAMIRKDGQPRKKRKRWTTKPPGVQVQTRLYQEELDMVRERAARVGLSVPKYIRRAVEYYLAFEKV